MAEEAETAAAVAAVEEAEAAAEDSEASEAAAAAALVERSQGMQSEAAAAEAEATAREAGAAAAGDEVKDEVEDEVEDETEYVEDNGCVIIPDEPANSAPPPPPVMVDPLLNALQTLQTVGKAQTRTEVYQSLALDVANPDTILPCWCQLCLRLYRGRKECFRCLGEKDRKHSCGLGKVSNYLVKPGANKAQLRGEFSKHFEGSARMTMKYVNTLAAYRQR